MKTPQLTVICLFIFLKIFCVNSMLRANQSVTDSACGAKCLYVILRGYDKPPQSLREVIKELGPTPKEGYSLFELQEYTKKRGFFAISAELDEAALRRAVSQGSVIIHLKESGLLSRGHYVICESIHETGIQILDPSSSVPLVVSDDLFSMWTGNALVVSDKPIDLTIASASTAWYQRFSTWLLLIGFIGVAIVGWRYRRGLSSVAVLLFLGLSGCTKVDQTTGPMDSQKSEQSIASPLANIENQTSQIKDNTKVLSAATPPPNTGVWVEKKEIDAGVLRRDLSPHVVPIKLYNTEDYPISIENGHYSCSCIYGSFTQQKIPPKESIDFNVRLSCKDLGPFQGTATILLSNQETFSVSAKWSVVTSMTTEPESIGGLELSPGESKEASLKITPLESFDLSKLEAKVEVNPDSRDKLSASAQIEGDLCTLRFTAIDNAPTGQANGKIFIAIPNDPNVKVMVLFTLYIANPVDVTPQQLYFTERNNRFEAQVIVESKDIDSLDPIELKWIAGDTRSPCEFRVTTDSDTKIFTIEASSELTNGVTELEILGKEGRLIKRLPVFFPDRGPSK